MNILNKRFIFVFFLFFAIISVWASNPHVINIYRGQYKADNKNWAIGQDERGVMYFGNDVGLLEFDGIEWKLNSVPNSRIARSVALLSHETIFTGSYEDFGRWDRDLSGTLVYTSLSHGLDKGIMQSDDFWKIWIAKDVVYFQSFSSIYVYDYKTVKKVSMKNGFLLLSKVRDEFLVQEMNGALYRLKGDALYKIEGSQIFSTTDVRVILPYADNKYLIGTTTKGIYIYDGREFKEWNNSLSSLMNTKDLNCGLLSTRGTYFLGTILDGIYEVDNTGRVIDHISSESTLQNNTILALYEDSSNNIWAALDRGIAYIRYVQDLSYYIDPSGNTGAIYDAILWENKLFIGTNQGVFYIPKDELYKPNALAGMKLIDGTQGQVWSFNIIDGNLYCCHNRGLKQINNNLSVSDLFSIGTGVFNVSQTTLNGKDLLLLSTYQSLVVIDKKTNTVYTPSPDLGTIINAAFDHLGNIWLVHFNRGVYRCKLKSDLSGFENCTYYGGDSKDELPYKLRLFKVGGRIVLLGDDQFYTYDDIANKIVPNTPLNVCFNGLKNLKQVVAIEDNLFWVLTNKSIYKLSYDGYKAAIVESCNLGMNLSMVNAYENVSIISNSANLICLDNGFLLYNRGKANYVKEKLPLPYIEFLQTLNTSGDIESGDMAEDIKVSYNYNTITIGFSSNNTFVSDLSFQYILENVDNDWSAPQKVNKISYARLPKGHYVFKIRTVDNMGNYSDAVSIAFEILPPWYQTFWAYFLYICILILIFYSMWMLILKRYRNLHLQKIRYRETKRLRALAGELQSEIEQKSAELLTQTSFIIQKNELILKVKDIVDEFYSKNKSSSLIPLYQKINALLNNDLNSEDDWKMFLIKFEEKHTGFFKKMKTIYPQLTNNDLRLCACLKLNLETKEIASLMNLSVRAVENSRYRLRKKLNILPSQNLNEFFLNID